MTPLKLTGCKFSSARSVIRHEIGNGNFPCTEGVKASISIGVEKAWELSACFIIYPLVLVSFTVCNTRRSYIQSPWVNAGVTNFIPSRFAQHLSGILGMRIFTQTIKNHI